MIKLRQAELQTYLDEIPRVAPVRAVLGAIVEEAPLAGLGFGLSVLAAGTPLGELVTGVISVGKRVREKVRAVNAYYERDSQDDMLDLADAVDGDREIFEPPARSVGGCHRPGRGGQRPASESIARAITAQGEW
jgi:hypothetical protein